jgi:hypothetical protein
MRGRQRARRTCSEWGRALRGALLTSQVGRKRLRRAFGVIGEVEGKHREESDSGCNGTVQSNSESEGLQSRRIEKPWL